MKPIEIRYFRQMGEDLVDMMFSMDCLPDDLYHKLYACRPFHMRAYGQHLTLWLLHETFTI